MSQKRDASPSRGKEKTHFTKEEEHKDVPQKLEEEQGCQPPEAHQSRAGHDQTFSP